METKTSSPPPPTPRRRVNPNNRLHGLRKKIEELSILTDCEALLIAYPNPSSSTSACFSWPDDPKKRLATIERYRKVTKQENETEEAIAKVVGRGKEGFSDGDEWSEGELDEYLWRINGIQRAVDERIRGIKLKEEKGAGGEVFDEVEICTSWEGDCSDYSGLEEGEIVEVADGGRGGRTARMETEVGCSKSDNEEHWPGSELVLALPGTDAYRGITGNVKQKKQEFCRETPQKQISPKYCSVMKKKGEIYGGIDNDHQKEQEFCLEKPHRPQKRTSLEYCGVMKKEGEPYVCLDNDHQKEQEFCPKDPQRQTSSKYCGVDDDHQKPPGALVLETEASKDAYKPMKKRKHRWPLEATAEPSLKKANRLQNVLMENVSADPIVTEESKEDGSRDLSGLPCQKRDRASVSGVNLTKQ